MKFEQKRNEDVSFLRIVFSVVLHRFRASSLYYVQSSILSASYRISSQKIHNSQKTDPKAIPQIPPPSPLFSERSVRRKGKSFRRGRESPCHR